MDLFPNNVITCLTACQYMERKKLQKYYG